MSRFLAKSSYLDWPGSVLSAGRVQPRRLRLLSYTLHGESYRDWHSFLNSCPHLRPCADFVCSNKLISSSFFMRGGKNASQAQPLISAEGPRASGSGIHASNQQDITPADNTGSRSSNTQPSGPDEQSDFITGSASSSNAGLYQNILIECNALVEEYRKGEIPKSTVYVEIQSKLAKALGDDRARSDAAFGSFIATIESHDSELMQAAKRGTAYEGRERSTSPDFSDDVGQHSDGEPVSKKAKVDESTFAWVASKKDKHTVLSDNLVKTLKLIDAYTVDPKATKRSLTNQSDCHEFPDSEWKNVVSGRAVSLDAVLSGQLSTTNDDLKVEKFGDLEISFGAVEPTKMIKNGGDWSITWNRTVRAIAFAFPHRLQELTSYGEYIINLFSVTHSSVHNRVISFDKAAHKRTGSVRNLELSDFEKFSDLKIAHMDSIGVSVVSGGSKEDSGRKSRRGKNWKRDEPCNKWNEGKCSQAEEECRRHHVCNRCRKAGHRGKDCRSN